MTISSTTERDALRQAIAAAKAGNQPLARLHLDAAIKSDPQNPNCWIWFAWVAESPASSISALQQARRTAPQDESVQGLIEQGMAWARAIQEFDPDMDGPVDDVEPVAESEPAAAAPLDGGTVVLDEAVPSDHWDDLHVQLQGMGDQAEPAETASTVGAGLGEDPAAHQQVHCASDDAEQASTLLLAADSGNEDCDELYGELNEIRACAEDATGTRHEEEESNEPDSRLPQAAFADDEPSLDSWEDDLDTETAWEQPEVVEVPSEPVPKANPEDATATDTEETEDADAVPEEPPVWRAEIVSSPSEDPVPELTETDTVADSPEADTRPLILAVDDSPTIRKLVYMTLTKSGYNVCTATDGMDALNQLKTCKPALVLLDINMPRLNGYQLCKLIKKHEEMRMIRVVMLSGNDGVFHKARGKLCGCDDYIEKPFESAHLVRKVSSFVPLPALEA